MASPIIFQKGLRCPEGPIPCKVEATAKTFKKKGDTPHPCSITLKGNQFAPQLFKRVVVPRFWSLPTSLKKTSWHPVCPKKIRDGTMVTLTKECGGGNTHFIKEDGSVREDASNNVWGSLHQSHFQRSPQASLKVAVLNKCGSIVQNVQNGANRDQ